MRAPPRSSFNCSPRLASGYPIHPVFLLLGENQTRPDVRGILRGEGWVVGEGLANAQKAVSKAHANMDTGMPSMVEVLPKPWPTPPTYFELNAFTTAYQVRPCVSRLSSVFCFGLFRSGWIRCFSRGGLYIFVKEETLGVVCHNGFMSLLFFLLISLFFFRAFGDVNEHNMRA